MLDKNKVIHQQPFAAIQSLESSQTLTNTKSSIRRPKSGRLRPKVFSLTSGVILAPACLAGLDHRCNPEISKKNWKRREEEDKEGGGGGGRRRRPIC